MSCTFHIILIKRECMCVCVCHHCESI